MQKQANKVRVAAGGQADEWNGTVSSIVILFRGTLFAAPFRAKGRG
jgi:hypothetical protein